MSPEMSTKNRGSILAAERGTIKGDDTTGEYVGNAFLEPEDCHGRGGTDPSNIVDLDND